MDYENAGGDRFEGKFRDRHIPRLLHLCDNLTLTRHSLLQRMHLATIATAARLPAAMTATSRRAAARRPPTTTGMFQPYPSRSRLSFGQCF